MRRRRDKDEGEDKQPEEPASVVDAHLEATTNGFVSDDDESLLMWQSFMWQHTIEPVGSGFRSEQSSLPGASAVSQGRDSQDFEALLAVVLEPITVLPVPEVGSVAPPETTRAENEAPNAGNANASSRLEESRGAHVMRGEVVADGPRGVHVTKDDSFRSVECRALHAAKAEPVAQLDLSISEPQSEAGVAPLANTSPPPATAPEIHVSGHAAALAATPGPRPKRRDAGTVGSRRRRLIPLAGGAAVLAVALTGGTAFAYMLGSGSGSGQARAGGPISAAITATTGNADLLPGLAGAVYFTMHDASSSSAIFQQVARGATVVSDKPGVCPSEDVSIAQTLPYAIPAEITVGPDATSGTQSIDNFVEIAPNAPSACQGVTFTVTFTLTGVSS